MTSVEFTAELNGSGTLTIPPDAASRLPKSGRVRVIVLTEQDADDQSWFAAPYQQFLSDDAGEDDIHQPMR